ncbi:MAG: hypothetical protein AAF600_15745 [Bacteroidota bacterium]
MKAEEKVKQHDKLIGELISLHHESSRRLKIMKNIQAVVIPVYAILGLSGLAALFKVFGVF